ncbi:tetratricopeptide repeat family protein [Bacteroidia bacterium]|nr:tetratricopeptide repeat family protein [Bacteroidia bacterium]
MATYQIHINERQMFGKSLVTMLKSIPDLVSFEPIVAKAYNNMGNAYYQQENYTQAIKCYQKGVEIDPNDAKAYYNMGNAYRQQENYAQAIKCYQEAIEIDPNDAAAYYSMGYTYARQENYTQAIKCYQKAIEIKPDFAWVYNSMGYAYAGMKKYGEAIANIKKAIEIAIADEDKAVANFYDSMGEIYFMQGNETEAVKWYRKAASMGLKNAQKWLRDNGYKW